MEDKIYYLDFKTLENFMRDSLVGAGVPLEDAKICADVLITADKRGIDSHGIGRLKPIYIDRIRDGIQNPKTTVEMIKSTPTTAVYDAHDGMGMVASKQAMQYAIDAAKIGRELGWKPQETFDSGIRKTVEWYLANRDTWCAHVLSGAYKMERLGTGGK